MLTSFIKYFKKLFILIQLFLLILVFGFLRTTKIPNQLQLNTKIILVEDVNLFPEYYLVAPTTKEFKEKIKNNPIQIYFLNNKKTKFIKPKWLEDNLILNHLFQDEEKWQGEIVLIGFGKQSILKYLWKNIS